MFGNLLENLTKAVVNTVTLPISIAADVITMGGALTDTDKPYTVEKIQEVFKNLNNAGK